MRGFQIFTQYIIQLKECIRHIIQRVRNTKQCVASYVIECNDKVCKEICISCNAIYVIVQSLSHIQFFVIPRTTAHQASLSFAVSQSLLRIMSIESVVHPTISSTISPFSCPQYFPASGSFQGSWLFTSGGFSFIISSSNEYLGLISFKIDWLDLLFVQGTLKSLLQHHSSKASILPCSALCVGQFISINDYWINHSFDYTDKR